MSTLEKLRDSRSLNDLSKLLGYRSAGLAYILYKIPPDQKYTVFTIPKKIGGNRIITAPTEHLKLVQRRLADILNSCAQDNEINAPVRRRPLAHGFKKKLNMGKNIEKTDIPVSLGIHTNANCHRNKRYVFNLDLKNFFPSFNFGRVRGFFIKNQNFLLNDKIATLVAQIACHENELPQGSPCSPIITNLIAHVLDVRLVVLAKKNHCNFSRYADDITFSTNQWEFPEEIAKEKNGKWYVGEDLERIINRSGFEICPTKTRMQYHQSRQVVTGLVVNKKVNIRRDYYRHARSMCHALFNTGQFYLPSERSKCGSISQLAGILNHIYFIKSFDSKKNQKNKCEETSNRRGCKRIDSHVALYSKFLFYRHFVALENPLIVCEGKTDVVYLKCAKARLAANSVLRSINSVRFFKHNETTENVMDIKPSASGLKEFIKNFSIRTKFTSQPRKHPVVVLLDNDKEAQEILNMLGGKKHKKPRINYDRNKTFKYSVVDNLFVAILPKDPGVENKIIEDFFDPLITSQEYEGKKLCFGDGSASAKQYSKQVFATRIVGPNRDKIDFSEFARIFSLIDEIIQDYYK